ncbi:hypothetical protein RW64_16580 [Geobacter sulfurreducens]|nr:hypothetical protein RW64_16580 [Geobacter sulfurreducens]
MKKKMITLLAGALMTIAMAANASAYFEQGNLIRVVYDRTLMTEVATDLGSISSILPAAGGSVVLGGGTNSYLGGALAGSSMANLNVAYFTVNVANKDLWLSSSNAAQNLTSSTSWVASSGGIASVLNRYLPFNNQTQTLSMSDASSYWNKLDGNGTRIGNFNTFLLAGAGEKNLAVLATGGTVAQNLFFWDNPNIASGVTGAKLDITIETLADGSTRISSTQEPPSSVPVPAAAYLLGSGLLGLVGIRRKMNK